MDKKLVVGIIVVIALGIGGGATWYAISQKPENAPTADNQPSVSEVNQTSDQEQSASGSSVSTDNAIAKLKSAGMNVSEDQGTIYQMVHADSGVKVTVNDVVVEIYGYSSSVAQANGLKALQDLRASMSESPTFADPEATDMQAEIIEHDDLIIVVHSSDNTLISRIKQALDS